MISDYLLMELKYKDGFIPTGEHLEELSKLTFTDKLKMKYLINLKVNLPVFYYLLKGEMITDEKKNQKAMLLFEISIFLI